MTISSTTAGPMPWWTEPTKDQWMAWVAAWLGWTLDAFDFTIFLLIMVPIAETFKVPLIEVTAVFTITLWLRLVGAVGSGWLADRIGRKTPLMISILWYSICNFAAGLSPTFALLFLFRALLGIGMGAEWPAGADRRRRAALDYRRVAVRTEARSLKDAICLAGRPEKRDCSRQFGSHLGNPG